MLEQTKGRKTVAGDSEWNFLYFSKKAERQAPFVTQLRVKFEVAYIIHRE